jgi:hypothetical protein
MRVALKACFGFSLVILTGCAGLSPVPYGSTIERVEEAWGKPSQRHTLPTGARLIYSFGPLGTSVIVAEFDRSGKLLRQYDAMNFPILARVKAGWRKWEVERELGPAFWLARYRFSSNISGVYRYEAPSSRQCFYVEYDNSDTVLSTTIAPERSPRDLAPGESPC